MHFTTTQKKKTHISPTLLLKQQCKTNLTTYTAEKSNTRTHTLCTTLPSQIHAVETAHLSHTEASRQERQTDGQGLSQSPSLCPPHRRPQAPSAAPSGTAPMSSCCRSAPRPNTLQTHTERERERERVPLVHHTVLLHLRFKCTDIRGLNQLTVHYQRAVWTTACLISWP